MLGKLLKYDLKWIFKVLYIFYIIILIVTLITKFIGTLEKTTMMIILEKIFSGVFIACCVNIVINCLMRIWVRFRTNLYKDESYLTHTLPVKKSQLFNSKVISMFITTIVSVIIILCCIAIIYLNSDTIEALKYLYNSLVKVYDTGKTIGLIIATVCLIILEFTFMIFSGVFGIVLGHKFNNAKLLKSILIGFATYVVLSLLTLGIVYIIALVNPTMMELFTVGIPSTEVMPLLIYTTLIIYGIYNLSYYFLCKKILNKGVNID